MPVSQPPQTPCPFELRFDSVAVNGHGYAFACDEEGHVDLDALSPRARDNYLFARACVGFELYGPVVVPALQH